MALRASARRSSRLLLWILLLLSLAGLTVLVAVSPMKTTLLVLTATGAVLLVRKFGFREGTWYLLIAALPLRHPLSVDIRGTVSLFPTDILLAFLLADLLYRNGVRRLWTESLVFRLGTLLFVLSIPGLYTAGHFFWGIASLYRIGGQIAFFAAAFLIVRSGDTANRTLAAIVLGLLPAVLYGFYQSTLPVDAPLPDWANRLIAYGPSGEPNLRVFSTFTQPLRFSLYLSVGLGISLGVLTSGLSGRTRAAVLLVGLAGAWVNLFTYSIGGTLGMLGAVSAFLLLNRKRRLTLLVPILVALWILLSPTALVSKFDRVVTGKATTAAARLVTYRQALDILGDHPLLGVGWGGIRTSLEHEYRLTRATAVAFGAENYFLQRGIALGFPGIAIVLLLAVLFFRNAARPARTGYTKEWPRAALLTGGAAFYLQAQTFPVAFEEGNFVLWVLFALAETGHRGGDASEEEGFD